MASEKAGLSYVSKIYIDLFRSFDRKKEVFVGMPFSTQFKSRWKEIFEPAIVSFSLNPYRTKEILVSNSITIDILDGISRARFLLFDISDEKGKPNPNVMYELGIAHAVRFPEEVIVLRDDISQSNTSDISHIRWNTFSPEETEKSITKIKELIKNAEKEIDLTKDRLVTKVVNLLDIDMLSFLDTLQNFFEETKESSETGFDLHPFDSERKGLYELNYKECREIDLRNIARKLIEDGILMPAELVPLPPQKKIYGGTPEYYFTELGKTVLFKLKTIKETEKRNE
jgi:hypothetical protein